MDNVDDLLRAEIARRNEQESDLWSSPDCDKRDSAHAFFQYPAMMVPVVQRNLIDLITSVQPDVRTVLDPFVGAGTTLTAAMYKGLDCYGQDINPLAVLLSRSKTGPFFCDSLARRVQETVQVARADDSKEIEVEFPNLYKWFRHDVAVELSRLRRAIRRQGQAWARRFLWVALAETIRLTSNDRTSTYKLHVRPVGEVVGRKTSPIEVFSAVTERNLNDLLRLRLALEQCGYARRGRYTGKVKVLLRDTTEAVTPPDGEAGQLHDLLVTSPPYGDNTSTITYGQHSYLPLQWIDLSDIDPAADESYLRTTQEIDRRSLGGKRPRELEDQIAELGSRSESLAATLQALVDKPRDRAARVAAFHADLEAALDCIVSSLAPNAYMIWTVGNRRVGGIEIPNHQILTEMLESRDAKLVAQVERVIHQKRMPHRNQIAEMMSRERILVFRRIANTGTVQ